MDQMYAEEPKGEAIVWVRKMENFACILLFTTIADSSAAGTSATGIFSYGLMYAFNFNASAVNLRMRLKGHRSDVPGKNEGKTN